MKKLSSYDRVYAAVRRIPPGRVATYGQIAEQVRLPRGARQVGYALASLPTGTSVPWHRVVNATGGISLRGHSAITQRLRLEREGIVVNASGRVDLRTYRWKPARASASTAARRPRRPP